MDFSSGTDRVQTDPIRKVKMKFHLYLATNSRCLTRRGQSRLLDVLKMEKKQESASHKWK
jgi:hypothetical protein